MHLLLRYYPLNVTHPHIKQPSKFYGQLSLVTVNLWSCLMSLVQKFRIIRNSTIAINDHYSWGLNACEITSVYMYHCKVAWNQIGTKLALATFKLSFKFTLTLQYYGAIPDWEKFFQICFYHLTYHHPEQCCWFLQ